MGVELTGKTLGIVGCGNIGSIVAERTLGLKMKVIASDPTSTPEHATEIGVEKVELDELFARAEDNHFTHAVDGFDQGHIERRKFCEDA